MKTHTNTLDCIPQSDGSISLENHDWSSIHILEEFIMWQWIYWTEVQEYSCFLLISNVLFVNIVHHCYGRVYRGSCGSLDGTGPKGTHTGTGYVFGDLGPNTMKRQLVDASQFHQTEDNSDKS